MRLQSGRRQGKHTNSDDVPSFVHYIEKFVYGKIDDVSQKRGNSVRRLLSREMSLCHRFRHENQPYRIDFAKTESSGKLHKFP